ncbi:hypothetical protein ACQSMD_24680 [Streptomyces flavovirens]
MPHPPGPGGRRAPGRARYDEAGAADASRVRRPRVRENEGYQ